MNTPKTAPKTTAQRAAELRDDLAAMGRGWFTFDAKLAAEWKSELRAIEAEAVQA